MVDEPRRGPGRMSPDELAEFMASRPSGALCVTDDDGRLLALPARVLDAGDAIVRVELPHRDRTPAFETARQGCLVADTFESYEGIRGVIARGPATLADPAVPTLVIMTLKHMATFSFADSGVNPAQPQAD